MREEMAPVLEGLFFPFHNPNWPARLWWVALVNFIPVFGLIVMRGWRLDITRRFGHGNPDRLPHFNDIGRFFADGLVLWTMTGIYSIPLVIIITLFGSDTLDIAFSALLFFWGQLTNEPTMTITQFMSDIVIGFLVEASAPIAYQLFSLPLYRTAMIRYALHGNPLVFFDFVRNTKLCITFLSGVMGAVFATIAVNFLINGLFSIFVASTFVGAILIPILTIPLSYWVVGYIYGRLARNMAGSLV